MPNDPGQPQNTSIVPALLEPSDKLGGSSAAPLPAWFPAWARELADLYFSGTTCLFVLHGNVHDLLRVVGPDGTASYVSLPELLAGQLFGSWDIVLRHDLGKGLRAEAGSDPERLQSMVKELSGRLGDLGALPREPDKILLLLDRYLERVLVEEDPKKRKSIGMIFDYAQYLAPAGDIDSLARGGGANLVRFLSWAQNPYLKRVNVAFALIADRLSEVNDRLVQNPHVAAIEVPLPERDEREAFVRWFASGSGGDLARLSELDATQLANASSGLTLVNLNVLLSQARRSQKRVDAARFKQLKKTMIERQCRGLLEFVEPAHKLDLVVGQEAAKERLRQDADLLTKGTLDAAPMGYLLCGPVGTGKTFLAECYAGSVGIPCVKLRNFRSKYVGETEGNLEQVLTVLRSLGPVVVLIDEADAALGNRQAEGDSGTSSRVFSMIASQMGDTRYRGKIVWMLLTCRPDLLPIDLKRQGRAEVHIPMFYPQDEAEIASMFLAMARKGKLKLVKEDLPHVKPERRLSGSDIESIVISARRKAVTQGRADVSKADLEQATAEFIPSAQGLEKELQEIAAVLECTELSFLPREFRSKVEAPEGRSRLQERLVAIRQIIEG